MIRSMLALLTGVAAMTAPAQAEVHALRRDHVLGTSLDVVAVGVDRATAERAFEAAATEIERLDLILSGWRADSELVRLNDAAELRVSPELYAVVEAAEAWRAHSGGAFDGRLGHVEALWRAAGTAPPNPEHLLAATAAARLRPIGLDAASGRVSRPAGVRFALDGLAKGYVIDAALAAGRLAAPGLQGLMVDIGGDLRVWGRAPTGAGWAVGIADPARPEDNAAPGALIRIGSGAVATSGRGGRDLEIGGGRYPTLFAPGTGEASCGVVLATAFAPRAVDADALATALAVLPPGEGLALAERTPGAAALIVDAAGRRHASAGWTRLADLPPPRLIRAAAPQVAAGAPWPAGFAVTVDYELPKINERRGYPPHVSIWITDQNNSVVRQLLLLGDNANYIDQNYVWWRRVGRSLPGGADAMSRPTRPAGRYSAVWDGKDNAGRPVGQGTYTVHLEATREHGGHSYQTVQVEVGAQPAEGAAAASDELGGTRVRYGKRT